MDGLAATLAAIAAGYFAIDAATVHENDLVLVLALSLAFACLGFLPFNVRPGRPAAIFMGDAGSQVLGFVLACLGLLASWNVAGTTVATLLLPILVLAVPILDTALVTIVRLLEGRPISQGGRDHTSHRIVYRGLSERRALVLLALVSAALGATSLTYTVLDDAWIATVGVLLSFALLVQFASFIGEVERRPDSATRLGRTLVVHRQRFVEVLVDFALITRLARDRLPPPRRRHRHRLPAAHRRGLAARDPRRPLRVLHPVRALPRRLALRLRDRRRARDRRGRRLGGRRGRVHRAHEPVRGLPARRLRDRRDHLHRARSAPRASASGPSRARSTSSPAARRSGARCSSAPAGPGAASSASCASSPTSASWASWTTTRGCAAAASSACACSAAPSPCRRSSSRPARTPCS